MMMIKIIRLLSWHRKPLLAQWRSGLYAVDIASVLKMKSIDLFYLKPLSGLSLSKSVSAANPHKRA